MPAFRPARGRRQAGEITRRGALIHPAANQIDLMGGEAAATGITDVARHRLGGWHEPTRGDLPELAGALGGVGISDKRERTRLAGTMARRAPAPENRCDVIGEGDVASPLRKPEQAA